MAVPKARRSTQEAFPIVQPSTHGGVTKPRDHVGIVGRPCPARCWSRRGNLGEQVGGGVTGVGGTQGEDVLTLGGIRGELHNGADRRAPASAASAPRLSSRAREHSSRSQHPSPPLLPAGGSRGQGQSKPCLWVSHPSWSHALTLPWARSPNTQGLLTPLGTKRCHDE